MPDAPALIDTGLTDQQEQILRKLRMQLKQHQWRNKLRSAYYDGEKKLRNMGISIPPQMRDIEVVVGWPAKAVDALEQRLDHEDFVLPSNSTAVGDLSDIMTENNMDLEKSQAHISALTHGTAFVFVTEGDPEEGDPEVVISVRSAREATASYDRRRRRITDALEVITDDERPSSDRNVILHLPDKSITLERNGRQWRIEDVAEHQLGRVPCEALVHRPFIERKFGQSRITRPVMSLTDIAVRTLLRQEVSAEFYSFPQRYVLGADEEQFEDKDGNVRTGWETLIGAVLALNHPEPDDEGDPQPPEVKVGQFPQQSMSPHSEQLRSVATMFSGETAIPVSYLGIIQDNPSSADAIRAGEAELVKVAERDQLSFGNTWQRVGQLSLMIANGQSELPRELLKLRSKWRDASTPTKQAQAQSTMTLVGAGILPPDEDVTWEQAGLDQVTIERLKAIKRRRAADEARRQLVAAAAATQGNPEVDEAVGAQGAA